MASETLRNALRAGRAAIEAGDLQTARAAFAHAVRTDPNCVDAWLWLGRLLAEPDRREYCARRVLALDPGNAEALRLLPRSPKPEPFEPLSLAASANRPVAAQPVPAPPSSATLPHPPLFTPSGAPSAGSASRRGGPGRAIAALLGMLTGLLVCGGPLTLAVATGQFDWAIVRPEVSPTAVPVSANAFPTFPPTWTPTPAIPTPRPDATLDAAARFASAQADTAAAWRLMQESRFQEALAILDRVIAQAPDYPDAYFQRAQAYQALTGNQRFLEEYVDYLTRALEDIDRAIALDPAEGEFYLVRYQIAEGFANVAHYRVDQAYWFGLALENIRLANALGNSDPLADRMPGFLLAHLGRCEEARAEFERLRAASPEPSAGLYTGLADAYLCAGRLDEALEAVDAALAISPNVAREQLRTTILLNLGRSQEALARLDRSLDEDPYYCGCRYYMRALVHYDRGHPEQALADIQLGSGQTWGQGGLRTYVLGLLARDAGDVAGAIAYLQDAEASLMHLAGPIVDRVRGDLADLGGSPLSLSPSVTLTATPLPLPEAISPMVPSPASPSGSLTPQSGETTAVQIVRPGPVAHVLAR